MGLFDDIVAQNKYAVKRGRIKHLKRRNKMFEGKYNTEAEMCEDVTKLILTLLIGNRDHVGAYAEMPRSSHNNHTDMVLVDYQSKEVIGIEYKLSGLRALYDQVKFDKWDRNYGITKIGILNSEERKSSVDTEIHSEAYVYRYTGKDSQIEAFTDVFCNPRGYSRWTSIFRSEMANLYYWGNMGKESNFSGGFKSGNRISLYELYMEAIRNIRKEYPCADFYIIYRILGIYSISQAKKYYHMVLKNKTYK